MVAKGKKAALATAFSIFINDSKLDLMSLGNLQKFNELTNEKKKVYDDRALFLNDIHRPVKGRRGGIRVRKKILKHTQSNFCLDYICRKTNQLKREYTGKFVHPNDYKEVATNMYKSMTDLDKMKIKKLYADEWNKDDIEVIEVDSDDVDDDDDDDDDVGCSLGIVGKRIVPFAKKKRLQLQAYIIIN